MPYYPVKHYANSSVKDLLMDPTARFLLGASGGTGASLSSPNTFTAAQTVSIPAVGTGTTAGEALTNSTAAAVGAQQNSPALTFTGQGWKTTATAASQPVVFNQLLVPVQGAAAPLFSFAENYSINGATAIAFSNRTYDGTNQVISVALGQSAAGQFSGFLGYDFGFANVIGGILCDPQQGIVRVGGMNGTLGSSKLALYSNNVEQARFDNSNNFLINTTTSGTGKVQVSGDVAMVTIGNRLRVAEGSGGFAGQATLVAGTLAITISGVTTSSRAFPGFVAQGGTSTSVYQYKMVCTTNTLTITAITVTGTTVTTDTSTLNYFVIN